MRFADRYFECRNNFGFWNRRAAGAAADADFPASGNLDAIQSLEMWWWRQLPLRDTEFFLQVTPALETPAYAQLSLPGQRLVVDA